ncbi:MAG: hypothetical protein KY432_08460, partial [Acidobacteria bacterium]|nr:hypothetical protein [Acidobacteriota bacterium]
VMPETSAPDETGEPEAEPEEVSLELDSELLDQETSEASFDDSQGIEIEEPSEEVMLDFDDGGGLDLEPEELVAETEEISEAEELEMSFDEEEPSPAASSPPAAAAPPPPSSEELNEIDFYIEQDLLEEASERLESMAEAHPEHAAVRQRLDAIAQKRAFTAGPAEPERPPALDIEAELLSAIPEDDEEELVASSGTGLAASPQPAPSLAAEISEEDEEGLFADEDDFFDLAAELEQELEGEFDDDISLSEEEQSLEDVFREFKKGVEEQLDAEDHETHYNLGIAYKEMGLIDEAIGEFQIASKDPKRTVECCSMLGLCFLEKGMPQLAIKWYNKGLEVPEITEDEHMGLLYELASAHVEVGDTTQAHKTFIEIYGVNSNYRDVADRIKQLENVAQQ